MAANMSQPQCVKKKSILVQLTFRYQLFPTYWGTKVPLGIKSTWGILTSWKRQHNNINSNNSIGSFQNIWFASQHLFNGSIINSQCVCLGTLIKAINLNSLDPARCDYNFNGQFSNRFWWLKFWTFPAKLPSHKCHKSTLAQLLACCHQAPLQKRTWVHVCKYLSLN